MGATAGPGSERIHAAARVPPDCDGERCDRVAARLFGEWSRARLARWIESGELRMDGRVVKVRTPVAAGAELVLDAVDAATEDWQGAAPDVPFTVCYEDAALLVIDKPAGVVVHPGAGRPDGTLVNGLIAHRPGLAALPRAGIVHRLDADTSGLMVVAASHASHHALVRAIAARDVLREYLAIVEGDYRGPARIDLPVGRDPRRRTRMAVRPGAGRHAVTHVEVIERLVGHTLLRARLETGRTHQIRVHCAHSGHPLAGDLLYGSRAPVPVGADPDAAATLRGFGRQALHATRLAFAHPLDGRPVVHESPMPDDMRELLDAIRRCWR